MAPPPLLCYVEIVVQLGNPTSSWKDGCSTLGRRQCENATPNGSRTSDEVTEMVRERPIVLTAEGKAALEQELEQLRTVKLPALRERLQQLSNEGDISDNSEYEDAKEELVLTEARIREIEHILRRAQTVVATGRRDEVRLGSRVTVVDEDGVTETWVIVSPEEANAAQGRISVESPVGAALLGNRVGTTVTVRAPGGEMRLTIQRIE